MLPHSLSTPETLNPMVLVFPSRDHVFSERSRASQSIDQSIDENVDQTIDQGTDFQNGLHNGLHTSNEPVVTSRGKLCLWCEHEGTTYESEHIQELQDEDYDSEYEDHSHDNQHNDRQNDPSMREYTQGFKQFMRELHGEVPYSDEELFDSESEAYLMTPHESPSKVRPFCDPHLALPSNLEQEPLGSEDNSDWCADRGSPAVLAGFGTPSISMENQGGALDDKRTSTQEALSSFGFTQTHMGHDEAPDDGFGGQRALQDEWPSDDDMRVESLRQMSVEALRLVENQSTTHLSYQKEIDVLMYDGNTWKQV